MSNTPIVPPLVREAPRYFGLTFVSAVFRIIGWLEVIVGGVVLALGIFGTASQGSGTTPLLPPGIVSLVYGIGIISSGLFIMAFGEAFEALRDIARHSFRR